MKPKKYNYYTVDTGFLGAPVKLCFDKDAFQEILKDHGINTKETALALGQAETHYFTQDKNGLIVIVYDFEDLESDEDFANTFSVIVHESVHVFHRIMDWIGEEEPGEEIAAYLTEWIAKQTLKGWTAERDKRNARKTNRTKTKPASKESGRTKLQVDQLGQRRSGSHSVSELVDVLNRIKDGDGETEL